MKFTSQILVFVFSAVAGAMILQSSRAQADVRLCGQAIDHRVFPPSSANAREINIFSGVWVGTTYITAAYRDCTAFVVQQVEPSGKVLVQQAWGDPGNDIKNSGRTTNAWQGHILDGGMVLISAPATYHLKVTPGNPNKMEGYVYTSKGRFPVSLDRTQTLR